MTDDRITTGRRSVLAGLGAMAMTRAASALEKAAPEAAGFAPDLSARIDRAIAEKKAWNIHGVVVLRHGRLVLERYFAGEDNARGRKLGRVDFTADTLHDLRSVSKSIVGLLYGIALDQGKVPAPEARLADAFPEYAELFAEPARAGWTLHHVLSMTLGTDWDELGVPYTDPTNSEIAMDAAPDRYRYILEQPVVIEPGRRWIYNGGATALLGKIIAKGTGQTLHGFARAALFDPMGLGPTEWFADAKGDAVAASGLRMRPVDLARVGLMVLGRGAFGGKQVVPAAWIERCVTPLVAVDEIRRYGYQWYMGTMSYSAPVAPRWDRARLAPFWSAVGNGGQRLFLYPELDLAVAITAGNYDTPDQWVPPTRIVRDVILPALAA